MCSLPQQEFLLLLFKNVIIFECQQVFIEPYDMPGPAPGIIHELKIIILNLISQDEIRQCI